MKATLADGTVLEGTLEEMLAMGVGGGGPRYMLVSQCSCVGCEMIGLTTWACPTHGTQYRIRFGPALPPPTFRYVWPTYETWCGVLPSAPVAN